MRVISVPMGMQYKQCHVLEDKYSYLFLLGLNLSQQGLFHLSYMKLSDEVKTLHGVPSGSIHMESITRLFSCNINYTLLVH